MPTQTFPVYHIYYVMLHEELGHMESTSYPQHFISFLYQSYQYTLCLNILCLYFPLSIIFLHLAEHDNPFSFILKGKREKVEAD